MNTDYDIIYLYYISYSEYLGDERDIIKELKLKLLELGIESEDINDLLKNFYQHYNIDISPTIIESVIISSNSSDNDSDSDFDSDNDFDFDLNNNEIINQNYNSIPFLENTNTQDRIAQIFNLSLFEQFPNPFLSFNNIIEQENQNNHTHQQITDFLNIINNQDFNPIIGSVFKDVIPVINKESIKQLNTYYLEKDLDTNCVICMCNQLSTEKVIELNCNHIFHYDCITSYLLKYNNKCPICRKEAGETEYINM